MKLGKSNVDCSPWRRRRKGRKRWMMKRKWMSILMRSWTSSRYIPSPLFLSHLLLSQPDNIRDVCGRRPDHPEYDPTTLKISDQFLKDQTPGRSFPFIPSLFIASLQVINSGGLSNHSISTPYCSSRLVRINDNISLMIEGW